MSTSRDIHDVDNLREIDNLRDLSSYAIQSQYSSSKSMLAIMAGLQKQLSVNGDIDVFYTKVYDIYTAEGWGLDNWGRIVGISRTIDDTETGTSITLDDDYYRLLLLYKCLANISAADAQSLNNLLAQLIATGIAGIPSAGYVLEVDTMVIRWVFEDFLNSLQRAVFRAAGQLARGAGVGWELYAINPDEVFGFDGSEMQPFNQAPFVPDGAVTTRQT